MLRDSTFAWILHSLYGIAIERNVIALYDNICKSFFFIFHLFFETEPSGDTGRLCFRNLTFNQTFAKNR